MQPAAGWGSNGRARDRGRSQHQSGVSLVVLTGKAKVYGVGRGAQD